MRVRDYIQEDSIDIGVSGTKTFNLDYTDPITQLDLFFEGTNGATGNVESPFERCISKIEIVDGGEVLWDLPGEVALAAYVQDNGAFPYSEAEEAAAASVRQQIPIRFGLKLFDPVYAFDPRRHKNPQLRFTFNEAAINTAGSTGFVSDSWAFTLHVRLMEDAPAPRAFLSYRSVETILGTAGGVRRIELPTDRTIRYLLCRAYEKGVSVYSAITNHKLSADGGKWVPFDLPSRDFLNRMCEVFDPVTRIFTSFAASGTTRETFMGVPLNGHVTHSISGVIASGNFYINGTVLLYYITHAGDAYDTSHAYITNTGWALHSTLMHAFGDRMNPADWLDPSALNKLDYYITDGNDGTDIDIAVQQVYGY